MGKQIYTEQELREKMRALPQIAQDYIFSPEMEAALQRVGQKHQLHIDKLGLLETEAVDVMIGATEPQDFVNNLVELLEIDVAEANAIAQDVNTELFEKIRAYMRGEAVPPAQTPAVEPVRAYVPPPITAPANSITSAATTQNASPMPQTQPLQPSAYTPQKPIVGFDKVSPTASIPVAPPITRVNTQPIPPAVSLSTNSTPQTPPPSIQPVQTQTPPAPPGSIVSAAALQQPTVTPVAAMPPAATDPNKPTKQYSTDPYHEPIE
jgi:hypothetical protein